MQFDFDTPIVRKNTWCTKWDMPTDFGRDDVIPMWIADMDFASPEPVREALMARAAQGAYGYIHPPKACAQAQVCLLYTSHPGGHQEVPEAGGPVGDWLRRSHDPRRHRERFRPQV